MILSGLKIRKALELEVPIDKIFLFDASSEGDISAKEIYEDDITHSSEIDNIEEIFKEDTFLYCSSKKREIQINKNLKAFTFNTYMAGMVSDNINKPSKIESEKTLEVIFLNTKILTYEEFLENIMDAQRFLGKIGAKTVSRRFTGIGSFNMEDYAMNHNLISYSDLHMHQFYLKDSGIVSTIGNIITANYEKDIVEQKEYFSPDEYIRLLDTHKRHKRIITTGMNYGIK